MYFLIFMLHLNFTIPKKAMEIKRIPYFEPEISTKLFGMLPNGTAVYSHELSNKNGMKLQVIDYGATITALQIPLKSGRIVDVVLGFPTLEDYVASFDLESAPYFGAIVGRFAGRIHNGAFMLNGKKIKLHQNNNGNSLHGGFHGFSTAVWKVKEAPSTFNASITFCYSSPNNDELFPGNLEVEVTYTLTEANEVQIDYKAKSDQDTIINLTHHSYFNLDGHAADVKKQEVTVNAHQILETTKDNIPTGRFLDLNNHEFDFNCAKKCPTKIDTTFIINQNDFAAASLSSKKNKLEMTVFTNQPAVHIYVGGNCFNTIKGKENASYHPLSGICFETQNFPDAPNHLHFPNAVLTKEDTYRQHTVYKFEIQ